MTPREAEAYEKAMISGKRSPELEDSILTDIAAGQPMWAACYYARDVIRGRWIEAEEVIMTNPRCCLYYADYVAKGKLPEKMHNMMILHAIENSDNWYIKDYFKYIESPNSYTVNPPLRSHKNV